MDERIIQFRVGIVVICAALIVGILIFLFGEGWTPQYTVYVEASKTPGVMKNTPVRKHGVLIGRVNKVESKEKSVLLTLKINRDEKLYESDVCMIGTASLLGDAVLDFVPGDIEPSANELADGTTLIEQRLIDPNHEGFSPVVVKTNPLELAELGVKLEEKLTGTLDSITRAGNRVDSVGKDIQGITGAFQEAFGGDDSDAKKFFKKFTELSDKADLALTNFNKMMDSVNNVVGDEKVQANIKQTIENLPTLISSAEEVMQEASETVKSFRDISKQVEINLENLEPFTKALGEDGAKIIQEIEESMQGVELLIDEINTAASEVTKFLRAVNSSDGSLNRLIKDPQLYKNINEAIRNIRDITVKIQPLLKDVRYITDGVARDPGGILRSAIQRRPPNTGYKGSSVGGSNWPDQ